MADGRSTAAAAEEVVGQSGVLPAGRVAARRGPPAQVTVASLARPEVAVVEGAASRARVRTMSRLEVPHRREVGVGHGNQSNARVHMSNPP